MSNIIFDEIYYYHVYNRGVDKRKIFMDNYDYLRFILGMKEFNRIEPIGSLFQLGRNNENIEKEIKIPKIIEFSEPLVELVCYCLNKNHYHLILRQKSKKGISRYMHKVGMGYTNYFNKKYERNGALLQGRYKYVHIESIEQLIYLSSYINGNAEIHGICPAKNWQWSSCKDYFGSKNNNIKCEKSLVLKEFMSVKEYKKYSSIVINEAKKRKEEQKEYILE